MRDSPCPFTDEGFFFWAAGWNARICCVNDCADSAEKQGELYMGELSKLPNIGKTVEE